MHSRSRWLFQFCSFFYLLCGFVFAAALVSPVEHMQQRVSGENVCCVCGGWISVVSSSSSGQSEGLNLLFKWGSSREQWQMTTDYMHRLTERPHWIKYLVHPSVISHKTLLTLTSNLLVTCIQSVFMWVFRKSFALKFFIPAFAL